MDHKTWTRPDIRAEVEKLGYSLTGLARARGLRLTSCRDAVSTVGSEAGERAIAQLIGVPLWQLWPGRWRPPVSDGGQPVRIDRRRERHKSPTSGA